MMTWAIEVALLLAALPAVAYCGYLLLFTLLSGRVAPPPAASSTPRMRYVVPAHNEEQGIAATVHSLLATDYPKDSFDVLVVADNCVDGTAQAARGAGAQVLERQNAEQRGKGYALHYAFEQLPPDVEAVVVIDADTLVSPNLLHAFAARLEQGADAMQADYAVRNADDSWRTRLMAVALGAFHIVRSRGRERLGLSCGLRGNGMGFRTAVLTRVPHQAYSIVEDVEYGLRLANAGVRIHYVDEAHVYGEMVSGAQAAKSQRRRWEDGRAELKRLYMKKYLLAGLGERNAVKFDLAMDMLVPPLSRIALLVLLGAVASVALQLTFGGLALPLAVWGSCFAALVVYVMRGWMLSGTGLRGLLDLGRAPFYMAWKIALKLSRLKKPEQEWIRTTREAEASRKP